MIPAHPQSPLSIGQTVAYLCHGSPNGQFPARLPRVGIVTEVYSQEVVSLLVVNPSGMWFQSKVSKGLDPGCWTYLLEGLDGRTPYPSDDPAVDPTRS